jgi:hypothetical protein
LFFAACGSSSLVLKIVIRDVKNNFREWRKLFPKIGNRVHVRILLTLRRSLTIKESFGSVQVKAVEKLPFLPLPLC